MMNFTTPISALRANQIALEVVGNNIANANTPGFHRQDARLTTRIPLERGGYQVGQGVEISHINRSFDKVTEDAITANISELEKATIQARSLVQIERLLTPGQGTILNQVENLFNEIERLTAHPDNLASRTVVLRTAETLAAEIRDLDSQIEGMKTELDQLISVAMTEIEQKSEELIELDAKIEISRARGESPNDLLDRRQQLVNEMAALVDVRPIQQENTGSDPPFIQWSYQLADSHISFMSRPLELESRINENGDRVVSKIGSNQEFSMSGGKLGGYLAARNGNLTDYAESLNEFTSRLTGALDNVHATGLPLTGSMRSTVSQRNISDVFAPLAESNSIVDIEAGSLFISVTDESTGRRTQHEVVIDPSNSADDLASQISSISNLNAVADVGTGKLILSTDQGFSFDFRSYLPTHVDTTVLTSTTEPAVSGQFSASENDRFHFRFLSDGVIGQTDGLKVEVTDIDGLFVTELDVGLGYESGTELAVGTGISISFGEGTTVANETFELSGVANADTSGVLTAFGMNTLFVGYRSDSIDVDPRLLENQELFATTVSGSPLDTANAIRFLDVRDQPLFKGGTQTAEQFFTDMVATVGVQVGQIQDAQSSLEAVAQTLKDRQGSISGVDLNEEAVRMLQYQKSFQANARYISTVERMLDELFNILR